MIDKTPKTFSRKEIMDHQDFIKTKNLRFAKGSIRRIKREAKD